MKRFFSILAMVAALTFVGCDVDSDIDGGGALPEGRRLTGAQWLIEFVDLSEPMSQTRYTDIARAYDMGYSSKGRLVAFYADTTKPGGEVGSDGVLGINDFKVFYDKDGNESRIETVGGITAMRIEFIDDNSAYVFIDNDIETFKLVRIEQPYQLNLQFDSRTKSSVEGAQWYVVGADKTMEGFTISRFIDIGLEKPYNITMFMRAMSSTNESVAVGEIAIDDRFIYEPLYDQTGKIIGVGNFDITILEVDENNATMEIYDETYQLKRVETPYELPEFEGVS